jgi:hypothetical protein
MKVGLKGDYSLFIFLMRNSYYIHAFTSFLEVNMTFCLQCYSSLESKFAVLF